MTNTSTTTVLYANDITGRIACAKHVGYTAQCGIEADGSAISYRGIDGDWFVIDNRFLADDYSYTVAAALVEAGIPLACEDC